MQCRSEFYAPCRTNKYPREIPELPWYRSAVPQMVMAGQAHPYLCSHPTMSVFNCLYACTHVWMDLPDGMHWPLPWQVLSMQCGCMYIHHQDCMPSLLQTHMSMAVTVRCADRPCTLIIQSVPALLYTLANSWRHIMSQDMSSAKSN